MQKHVSVFIASVLAIVVFGLGATAEAKSGYLTSFNSTYPTAPAAIKSCTLCHPGGKTSSLNNYALDYSASGRLFAPIEAKDSDADGFTNIAEISAGAFPGDAASKPVATAPTLTGLNITGPASVNENGVATYVATASWSNSSTSIVTPTWSENSAFATISAGGVLITSAVTANHGLSVSATYTRDGVTKAALIAVTILDVLAPPAGSDSDADGMPDTFEQTYGFDPSSAGDAILDADGDGLLNREEYIAGTHPKNPDTDNDGVWDGRDEMPKDPTRPVINEKGVYRYGIWYLDNNGNMSWDKAMDTFCGTFGTAQMQPVVGDWNGDGKSEIAAFENGVWYLDINGSGKWDAGDLKTVFGTAQMIPVAGDWNGDGKSEIGAFENGTWYLDANGNGVWDGGDLLVYFGNAQMIPVVGDWNGVGKSEVGAYEKGVWYLDANGNGKWDGVASGDTLIKFGTDSMLPIAGDWNGDGRTEIGTFENGKWYMDKDGNGQWNPAVDIAGSNFGFVSDVPVVGDWNGNGFNQIGIWR